MHNAFVQKKIDEMNEIIDDGPFDNWPIFTAKTWFFLVFSTGFAFGVWLAFWMLLIRGLL